MLKKENRLRRGPEIKLVYLRGRRIDFPSFRLFFMRSSAKATEGAVPHSRFAFVVSRVVSKRATVRNTLRRRAREWIRKRPSGLPVGTDAVLVFSKQAPTVPRKDFYEELEHAFEKLNHCAR